MKAEDAKREGVEERFDDGQQIGLGDLLAGGDQFPLGDAVDGVDVIDALDAIPVALMHAVDADETRTPIRYRRPAYADGNACRSGLGEDLPASQVATFLAQVVKMSHRDRRQLRVASIPVALQRPAHQMHGRRAGQGIVQGVRFRQQHYVQVGEFARPAALWRTIALA